MGAVTIHKFEVVAEHPNQVLLQPHHQGMHPGIKDHVGPFRPHLG